VRRGGRLVEGVDHGVERGTVNHLQHAHARACRDTRYLHKY
jgi:hypothetical protein